MCEGADRSDPCDDIVNGTGSVDPWVHRSVGMRCVSCMWFAPKIGFTSGVGRCRRHAPTMTGYPVVFQSDWCGDHKLDENK